MPGAVLPVGTVTFVFTDIEGSTGLAQDLGRQVAVVLDDHHRILRKVVADARGVVVSTEGDGFFCAFPSAVQAVSAATEAQRALASHEWPVSGTVRVRIGIHTGEAVLGGDNYVGLDVHRASRIAAAAHGGQVLLSATTAGLVVNDLPAGVTLRDLGHHELKDLGLAERLHQLAIAGVENDFPPVRSMRVFASRLPAPPTSFIGRTEELNAVRALLDLPGLVTLLGPGGSGKTRLAIEAARRSSSAFEGFSFVDLSATSNPDLLAAFVASALSVVDSANTPAHDLVAVHVGESRYLLVMDNCEHVIAGASILIVQLLERCPRLTVLATTRQSLDVPGERVQLVGGLATEEDGDHRDAVQLFVERATAVAPQLDIDHWSSDIDELCRRLDGIPLAIELAAARASVLTPGDILDRLDDRFTLLRSRSPTAVPRHRSLEAAIGWSYEALEAEEQSFLRRLSVFRGGFTLEAAEAVCLGMDLDPARADALDLLSSLVAKSFVSFRPGKSGARYDLLETIREYTAMQLHETDDAEKAAGLHRDYFLDWAKHQARRLSSSDQLPALEDLESDHINLTAVIERGIEGDDRESALAMAATLVWFWYVHSHFTEGNYWSSRLLADRHGTPTRTLVRLLIGAGDFDFRIGEHDRATARFEQALEGARLLGSESLAMWALAYMATNDTLDLRLDRAHASLAEALEIANRIGDFLGASYCMFMDVSIRGWAAVQMGDFERLAPLSESLDTLASVARSAGERNMIGHVMQSVGLTAHWMGDEERARSALAESLAAFAEINTHACASHCLEAIAMTVAEPNPSAAVQLLAGTQSIRDRVGIKTPRLEQELRRLTLEAAETALTADEVAAAGERGGHLTIAEAVALAQQALAGASPLN